jgi:hypothetical protein
MSIIYINPYQFAATGPTDPYFSNVSLLLHGDGTNGSTTIVDSSPSPKTVTAFGDAQISTAQSKFGGASIAFDGNSDYFSVPSSVDFEFGSGNFTIEFFAYINTYGTITAFISRSMWSGANGGTPWIVFALSEKIYFSVTDNATGAWGLSGAGGVSAPTGQWNHIAVVRNGSSFNAYVNGVAGTAKTFAGAIQPSNSSLISGVYNNTLGSVNGYIDDLRITKGVARYTSNFTPPTAPFPDA